MFTDTGSKNFKQDSAGTNRRVICSALEISKVLLGVNRLIGWQGRKLMSVNRHTSDAYDSATDVAPLFMSEFPDNWANGRWRVYFLSALPRVNAPVGGGDSFAHFWGGAEGAEASDLTIDTQVEQTGTVVATAPTAPDGVLDFAFIEERGDATNADAVIGVAVQNGFTVLDCVVYEAPLNSADFYGVRDAMDTSTNDVFAPLPLPQQQQDVLDTYPEAARAALHGFFEDHKRIAFTWSANDPVGQAAVTPNTLSASGIAIQDASFRNIFTPSGTSYTAWDQHNPGIFVDSFCADTGPVGNAVANQRPTLRLYVYAKTDTGAGGEIKIEGPNGSDTITGIGSTAAWYDTGTSGALMESRSNYENKDRNGAAMTASDINHVEIYGRDSLGNILYIYAFGAIFI